MKCPHCDYELVPGARFCDACGSPVPAEAEAAAPASIPASPSPEAFSLQPISSPAPEITPPPSPPPAPVITPAPEMKAPPAPAPITFPTPVAPPRPAPAPAAPQPVNFTPVTSFAPPAAVPAPEKILGIPVAQIGTVTLVLGIAGLALSCVGCGGLFAIGGLVTGFMGLKSAPGSNNKIGLVLSGLGIIVSLIAVCGFLYFSSQNQGNFGN
jgi:hypothetical protein